MRFPTPPSGWNKDDNPSGENPGPLDPFSAGDDSVDSSGHDADAFDAFLDASEDAEAATDARELEEYRESFGGNAAAFQLFVRGYRAQMGGEIPAALKLYRASIAAHPTAEAWTFLGWAFSFAKELDKAIACCLRAIRIDAGFGNPYNDIGAYLMAQGMEEEALSWFERAVEAPRYSPRQFAHCNAGIALERRGRIEDARAEFRAALDYEPDYALALAHKRRLDGLFN